MKRINHCPRCGGKRGLRTALCEGCAVKKTAEWRLTNKERRNASERARYHVDIERRRELSRKHSAKYKRNHPDKIKANNVRLRERKNELARMHYTPEIGREKNGRRRARMYGSLVSEDQWQEVLDRYNHTCLCCGVRGTLLTRDHIVPLSLGGRNDIENIQPLCRSCNSRKKAKIVDFRLSVEASC